MDKIEYLILALVCLAIAFAFGLSIAKCDIINGLSFTQLGDTSQLLTEAGNVNAKSIVHQVHWKTIQPTLSTYPTMAQAPGLVSSFVGNYAQLDDVVDSIRDAGMSQCLVIGMLDALPSLPDGRPATPTNVETVAQYNDPNYDHFLGSLYVFMRATVKRYKDRVDVFIIMPELNEMPLRCSFGWLTEDYAFRNFTWATMMANAQYRSVKDECTRPAYIMLHTDIHDNIHKDQMGIAISGPYNYYEVAQRWYMYCDGYTINAYPNYYTATPNYGNDLGVRVTRIKQLGEDVWVTECNYPVVGQSVYPPYPFQFSEENHAAFISKAYKSAKAAGASRFYFFNLFSGGVRDIYTQEDIDAFNILGPAFRNGNVTALLNFVGSHYNYVYGGRLYQVLMNHDGGLGFIINGRYTMGYFMLKNQYR